MRDVLNLYITDEKKSNIAGVDQYTLPWKILILVTKVNTVYCDHRDEQALVHPSVQVIFTVKSTLYFSLMYPQKAREKKSVCPFL